MPMDSSIISGIFALIGGLGGAGAGSLITRHALLTTTKQNNDTLLQSIRMNIDWDRALKDIVILCGQIKGFYHLEELYIKEISRLTRKPEKRIKLKMREQNAKTTRIKLEMTDNRADKIIKKWEYKKY
jgi:hypothetical protein